MSDIKPGDIVRIHPYTYNNDVIFAEFIHRGIQHYIVLDIDSNVDPEYEYNTTLMAVGEMGDEYYGDSIWFTKVA